MALRWVFKRRLITIFARLMKHLAYLNKFFYKYRWRLVPGVLFVVASNIFGVLPAQVIRIAFDLVSENIAIYQLYDGFSRQAVIYDIFGAGLLLFGGIVLALALIRGMFLFFYATDHHPDIAAY
jgi:ATP-binding cassette subfamily B multidrug efflux pump